MRVYPVIMCGGVGTRLWPLSRPSRPKQFVNLVGDHSLFQDAATRIQGLTGFEKLVVVTHQSFHPWVSRHLALINVTADILLEPVRRDSAPAIALAALHIHELDPEGIAVIVAADHFIPDAAHFRAEVEKAVATADSGSIITLGIKPCFASAAYGYIKPGPADRESPTRPVLSFHEKPDVETAARYIGDGYLWNSGNFIARADTLIEQFQHHAPKIIKHVKAGYGERTALGDGVLVGPSLSHASKASMDTAIMEKTDARSVLPTTLDWSDMGMWSAIHSAMAKDDNDNSVQGRAVLNDARNCAARGPDDKLIVLSGVDGLNVVVDDEVVLVMPLAQSDDLKTVTDQLARAHHPELDLAPTSATLGERTRRLQMWWETAALPLWFANGFDHTGGLWRESLQHNGKPTFEPVRGRVPGRQTFVYAQASRDNWAGPWRDVLSKALANMAKLASPTHGLIPSTLNAHGAVLDSGFNLYDQTFHLLALANAPSETTISATPISSTYAVPGMADAGGMGFAGVNTAAYNRALAVLAAIETHIFGQATGAAPRLSELDETCPQQSNPVMHLFEAALAWIETCRAQGLDVQPWMTLATEIASLCNDHLIDGERGHISETYDADWHAHPISETNPIETGHQFEWAWLLMRWQAITGDKVSANWHNHAKRLFAVGLRGLDPHSMSIVSHLDANHERSATVGRFWCQLDWLKAALVLFEAADAGEKSFYLYHIHLALDATEAFLNTPVRGLWYDKRRSDGSFIDEDVPASTLYHITSALTQLRETTARHPDM